MARLDTDPVIKSPKGPDFSRNLATLDKKKALVLGAILSLGLLVTQSNNNMPPILEQPLKPWPDPTKHELIRVLIDCPGSLVDPFSGADDAEIVKVSNQPLPSEGVVTHGMTSEDVCGPGPWVKIQEYAPIKKP